MPDLKHCTVQVKASYEWLSFTCTNGYANDAGRLTPKFRWVRLKNWNTKMAVLMATIMLNHDILGKSICKPTFWGQQVWTCPSIFCDSSSCPWTQHVGWWCRKGVEHVVNENQIPQFGSGLWVKWYMMNRLCWIHWASTNPGCFDPAGHLCFRQDPILEHLSEMYCQTSARSLELLSCGWWVMISWVIIHNP